MKLHAMNLLCRIFKVNENKSIKIQLKYVLPLKNRKSDGFTNSYNYVNIYKMSIALI
jgi:hypothetical protein